MSHSQRLSKFGVQLNLSLLCAEKVFSVSTNQRMRPMMQLLLVSIVLMFGAETKARCPTGCQCFQSSKYVSCNNINSFPIPPIPNSLYTAVVISQSNLYAFENLEEWTNLKEVFFPQTWIYCENFESINLPSEITFTFGINECKLPGYKSKEESSTIKMTSTESKTVSTLKETSNVIINITTSIYSSTDELNTMNSDHPKITEIDSFTTSNYIKKSNFNYWLILVSFNVFFFFSGILSFLMYFFRYKKSCFKRVNTTASPLPTRSQLDIPTSLDLSCDVTFSQSDEIEMESFASSYNNIYEPVASPYENIPYCNQ